MSSSNLTDVNETVMEFIIQDVKHLDIRGNTLKSLSQAVKNMKGASKLWISDNPYECNCHMLWMKDWLAETTNVQDKDNVTCLKHKTNGELIHLKTATWGSI